MRRFWSGFVLLVVLLTTLAPSLALLQFHLRRSYIERELCVQREVAADMRTCHGECHLARQLRALEQESQESFPGSRLDFRTEPAMKPSPERTGLILAVSSLFFPEQEAVIADGFTVSLDPVPWF